MFDLSSACTQFASVRNTFLPEPSLRQKLTKDWELDPQGNPYWQACELSNNSYFTQEYYVLKQGVLFLPAIFGVKGKWIQIPILPFYEVCSLKGSHSIIHISCLLYGAGRPRDISMRMRNCLT